MRDLPAAPRPSRSHGSAIASTFHTLIMQPTTLCNLDCDYCYLPSRKRQRLMTSDVATACATSIHAQASAFPVDVVWHGGEPTATPLPHFVALLAPFEELRTAERILHGIQTNATLITPQWCELFLAYRFEVGVSIDGPFWANASRRDRGGRETFDRTMRGVAMLRDHGIPFTTICVVTPDTIAYPDELAEFFEELGCESVGFNVEEQEGSHRPQVSENAAYEFWWHLIQRRLAGSPLRVRELDRLATYIEMTRDGDHQEALFDPIPTVAHNGDVVMLSPELMGITDVAYGRFVAGNVLTAPLPELIAKIGGLRYVTEFEEGLRGCAESCGFFDFCGGAHAGNRYFEHGTFATTETAYCRNTRQALVQAAADEMAEGR